MDDTQRLDSLLARDGVIACAVGEGAELDRTSVGHVTSRSKAIDGSEWHATLTQALDIFLKLEVMYSEESIRIMCGKYTISVMRMSPKHRPVAVVVESGHPFTKSLRRTVYKAFRAGSP